MVRAVVSVTAFALLCSGSVASAGDLPLYEAAPDWVTPIAQQNPEALTNSGTPLLVYDVQQKIDGATVRQYFDTVVHISTQEILSRYTTVTFNWFPDKGDLFIHELSIRRAGETIDLLGRGTRLEVLRREARLEQQQLTGLLTATTRLEGLQIGDIVRVRYSTSHRDPALAGNSQAVIPLLARPAAIGTGRFRTVWAAQDKIHWRINAEGVSASPVRKGSMLELDIALPLIKQTEMPVDAPARYRRPPMIEFSSFADWADVSRAMAPLYATESTINEDGPLAAEVKKIMSSASDDRTRAQAALRLVQDQVRYFANGLNGGNYVPQNPEETWQLRHGDCKAKTLLLLALLEAMSIEAEAVLAHTALGDSLPQRLPSAAAFDHVLVRARIDNSDVWLDGTLSGSRLADLGDTPPFRHVLPLRTQGAGLLALPMQTNARPSFELTMQSDESTSIDLPSVFDATAILRGPLAIQIEVARAGLEPEDQKEMIRVFFTELLGEGQFSQLSAISDTESATLTLRATGVVKSQWSWSDNRSHRALGMLLREAEFEPDRAKREWRDIPVATPPPEASAYRLVLKLPDGGRGYTLQGGSQTSAVAAGRRLARSAALADGTATIEERLDTTGVEIAPADLPQARRDFASIKTGEPKLRAPESATRRWDLASGKASGSQLSRIHAIYSKAISDRPDEAEGLISRASLLAGTGRFADARKDLTAALAISEDAATLIARSRISRLIGDLKSAALDARKAIEIDPSSSDAIAMLAEIDAERGDLSGAVALLDERIADGGENKEFYEAAKIAVIGEYGDPAEALTLLDAAKLKKPNNSDLLNAGCWIRGTRAFQVETALAECTRAIELSSSPVYALDSRSVVWFRKGQYEDALADLNSVLGASPGIAQSRLMRSIVLAKLGRVEDARRDRLIAETIDPGVVRQYRRYGLLP